jgi:hypothetical protein
VFNTLVAVNTDVFVVVIVVVFHIDASAYTISY